MKRILAVIMTLCILCGSLPVSAQELTAQENMTTSDEQSQIKENISEESNTVSDGNNKGEMETEEPGMDSKELDELNGLMQVQKSLDVLTDSSIVSRIEWLSELTRVFGMSVEQDNYPDNYYSDISSSSQYYYEIMLATEFGLVDVEAGEALRPEDPATREFVAHTLNLCLGYTLEEKIYTYQESSTVAWPEDIQISINKGWFQLINNSFMPEQSVTITEKEVLLVDAAAVLESVVINPNHNNQYVFADNVIVLPEGTAAVLSGENQVTIYNCPVTLKTGDVFAIIENDFPVVNKAISITISGEKTIVTVENVSTEEAFKSIDIQGSMSSDLTQAQAYDSDTQISYIVGGTQENEWEDGQKYEDPEQVNEQNVNAIEVVKSYDIPENVKADFNLGDGLKATITCKITDVQLKYASSAAGCYMDFNTIATFNCNVSLDVLKAIGVAPSIELVRVSVGVIGYATVSLDLTVKGNVTLSIVERISAGVHFSVAKGFRLVTDFNKISFTIQARAEVSVGITVAVGINAGFIKGSIYGKVGARATIEAETYTDGYDPSQCIQVQAWLYVTTGCKITVNILVFKKDWTKEITIYNFNNSPVRVSYHFEDGSPVDRCTRDAVNPVEEKRWKYYTPANSSYGYNGANSGTNSAGESYTIFDYSLDSDNRATITGYNGNVTALSIPDSLDGYTVVGIGGSAFKNNKVLIILVIPDTITNIANNAFEGCSNLQTLDMADSVVTLGNYAFNNCTALATVSLSKKIETIGYSAFANCVSLTEIEIPKSLSDVSYSSTNNGVFRNCSNLKKVSFESGTTKVARNLFYNCTGLEEITLPNTITTIEDRAFGNCSNLLELKLPDSVTLIGDRSFEECISIHTVILSKNIEEIGYSAFANCISLTEIEIPKSLNNVGFYDGVYNYKGAFRDCSNLKKVSFESGTTKVVSELFFSCTGLEEIDIPDTVTTIGVNAFSQCSNLRIVNIPDSVTDIGGNAFGACSSLLEVNIPNSVNEIGIYAFKNCTSLAKVSLPDSMVVLENGLFWGCQSLKEINMPETLHSIKSDSFRDCTSLEEIALPQSLVALDVYAFYNCKSLKKIFFHEGMKIINSYAFAGCSALQEVYLPDSLTFLGSYAFFGNQSLTDIRIGINLETIPANCFKDCGALQTITLPYGITSIGDSAFANNTSLTEVIMNRKVSSIVTNAFSYPDILTIYGVPGTYPEEYAASRKITFVAREVAATSAKFMDAEISVNKGQSFIPAITIEPEGFTDEIIWRSTDTDIITVSDKGVITAKKTGTAIVRVNVGKISAEVTIVVPQPVTSIALNKTTLSMEARETFTLTADISPSDAYDKAVNWTTSDSSVATVGSTGLVTAISKGTAVITATAKDGSGVSRSCNITVTNNAYICGDYTELESAHNYPDYFSDSWVYSQPGASSLTLTFDGRTSLESGFDYLYLYDGTGKEVGKYTGTELAGKTVLINGDTVRIKLVSDAAGNEWGFKVTSVMADIKPVEFSDVKEGSWQSAPAQYVYQRGIMTGKGTDASGNVIFAPNDNLTRSEFAQILYSAEGKPKLSYTQRFNDVVDGMWYTSAILWAADQRIVSGYGDGRYGTHDYITREQLAAMLYKYAEYKGYDTSAQTDLGSFTDSNKVSSWAKPQLQWAVANGVMSGKGTVLDPLGNATRAECAAMLRTFMNRFD